MTTKVWGLGLFYAMVAIAWFGGADLVVAEARSFAVRGADFFQETNCIFIGKLERKESYRSDDGRFIFTRHTFQVEEAIKGNLDRHVELIEYGGTVGEQTMGLSHGPMYMLDQEYLVFSYLDLLRHNRTLAGSLGQFRVITDSAGRRSIRVYPSHPLREVLGQEKEATFQDLIAFSQRLRKAMEKFSTQGKGSNAER
ncbi:MAG: hypothetical protein HY644_10955 [Acidobacteria bacterium]|nr:hypothetical protein [Acidobacteriota bacterium]